ncbi:MAG TPA: type IV pilus biogenesis protein PilP [Rhodanobacteraceae bacterium]
MAIETPTDPQQSTDPLVDTAAEPAPIDLDTDPETAEPSAPPDAQPITVPAGSRFEGFGTNGAAEADDGVAAPQPDAGEPAQPDDDLEDPDVVDDAPDPDAEAAANLGPVTATDPADMDEPVTVDAPDASPPDDGGLPSIGTLAERFHNRNKHANAAKPSGKPSKPASSKAKRAKIVGGVIVAVIVLIAIAHFAIGHHAAKPVPKLTSAKIALARAKLGLTHPKVARAAPAPHAVAPVAAAVKPVPATSIAAAAILATPHPQAPIANTAPPNMAAVHPVPAGTPLPETLRPRETVPNGTVSSAPANALATRFTAPPTSAPVKPVLPPVPQLPAVGSAVGPAGYAPYYDALDQLAYKANLLSLDAKIAALQHQIQRQNDPAPGNSPTAISLPPPVPVPAAAPAKASSTAATPVLSVPSMTDNTPSHGMQLYSIASSGGLRIAVMDINGGTAQVSPGQTLPNGWRVVRIGPDSIDLARGKQHKTLREGGN